MSILQQNNVFVYQNMPASGVVKRRKNCSNREEKAVK